jgi:peptide/nickel transport system substrate-binding protein
MNKNSFSANISLNEVLIMITCKRTAIILLSLTMIFSLISCGKIETENKDVLNIATGRDATRVTNYSPFGMWEPGALIYETLVNLDADCKPVPCLAESWEVSADGGKYIFHLRKEVQFHDGTLFTAMAVKENSEKLKYASWLAVSRYLKEVKVIDEYTIEFILKKNHPAFLLSLANYSSGIIAPSAIKAAAPDKFPKMEMKKEGMSDKGPMSAMKENSAMATAKGKRQNHVVVKAVGTGPYIWDTDKHIRNRSFSVVKNDNYWQGNPRFKRINWEVVPDASARAIALESGKIDLTGETPNSSLTCEDIKLLKSNEQFKVTSADNWGARLMIINHTRPPFDDIEVRRALKYAIDVKAIQKLLGDSSKICTGPLGPTSPLTDPSLKFYEYNPEKANKILDSKNITDTNHDGIREFNGQNISISIISSKVPTISVLMKEYFKAIGIELNIQQKEAGSTFQILAQMQFDIAVHSNIPSFSLNLSEQFSSKGGKWSMNLDDPDLERVIDQYRQSSSMEEYKKYAYQIQQMVDAKQIILFAINEQKVAAYRKELGTFIFPPEEWVGADQNLWQIK